MLTVLAADVRAQHVHLQLQRHAAGARVDDAARARRRVGFLSAVFGAGALVGALVRPRARARRRDDARRRRSSSPRAELLLAPVATACARRRCSCSSSARASPRGRRTRTRRCSSRRPTTCAAGSSASTSTRSTEPARSPGSSPAGSAHAAEPSSPSPSPGSSGSPQPGPPEPPSGAGPPIEIPRHAQVSAGTGISNILRPGGGPQPVRPLSPPEAALPRRDWVPASRERPRAKPAGSYGCRRRLSAARAVGPPAVPARYVRPPPTLRVGSGPLSFMAFMREELLDSGFEYVPGEPVLVRVVRREGTDARDRRRCWGAARWTCAGARRSRSRRRGAVRRQRRAPRQRLSPRRLPPVGPDAETIVHRIGEASLALYQELLDLE